MDRYEEVCKRMEELRARLREGERARAQARDLEAQAEDLGQRKWALEDTLRKEEADVAALEKMSVAALIQTVLGRKEERLEQERREAMAARLRYQEACRALEDVEHRLAQARKVIDREQGDRQEYQRLLEQKGRLLKERDPALAERLVPLEERQARCRALLKEIGEAQSAGRAVLAALDRAAGELDDAEGWGTWDMLGGGLFVTMAKHSHIDEARDAAARAQALLSRFRTELADVQVCADLRVDIGETATFCDYFFDGLIADWVVQSGIHDAQGNVEETRRQVEAVMRKLDGMERETGGELERTGEEIRGLIE